MILKKYILLLTLIFIYVNVISQNSFEFHGKISIDEGNPQTVRIVVTKDGKPYKTYRPESGGKYSFSLEYNSVYIVSYEHSGYVNKKVDVNTIVPDKVLKNDKFKYKWKTDVNLFKKYKGIDFSFFDEPIQKIFFNKSTNKFIYDDKYAKQIEKQLKEKMAEVEKQKAEERKQLEKEKLQRQRERQQAIQDSIASVKATQKQREIEYKQNLAEKKKQERDSIANARAKEQQNKIEQAKIREQERKKAAEEAKVKRENEKKRLEQERADKLKQIKEQAEARKAEMLKRLENIKAENERKRLALIEARKRDITEDYEETEHKKINRYTVTQGKITYNYRKVVWDWGGVFYFRNDKSISRSVFYIETRN